MNTKLVYKRVNKTTVKKIINKMLTVLKFLTEIDNFESYSIIIIVRYIQYSYMYIILYTMFLKRVTLLALKYSVRQYNTDIFEIFFYLQNICFKRFIFGILSEV